MKLRFFAPFFSLLVALGAALPANAQQLTLRPATVNQLEGNVGDTTTLTFQVSISNPSSSNATMVDIATSPGTATSGTDYVANQTTLTFPQGSLAPQDFTVVVNGDNTFEPDETFFVRLTNPRGGNGNPTITNATSTVTIINDDSIPRISIDNVNINEGNSPNNVTATFNVTLDRDSQDDISVNFTTADFGNGVNRATANSDYLPTSGTLTFNSGQTSKTIQVAVRGDNTDEADETFAVNLSNNSSGSNILAGQGIGTILDDDGPTISVRAVLPNGQLSNTTTVAESAGTVVFRISLSAPSPEAVTVAAMTTDGSAVSTNDYIAFQDLNLTIQPGASFVDVLVTIKQDTNDEPDQENFFFDISGASPTGTTIATSRATAIILDDDPLPTASISGNSVSESTPTLPFIVSLDRSSDLSVTVNYRTEDVQGSAVAGADYQARTSSVTFAPGTTSQTISINLINDTVVEPNETFRVRLTGATNATVDTTPPGTFGTGTILDDDGQPTISVINDTKNENNGPLVFNVALSQASNFPIILNYVTSDNTAIDPSDYTGVNSSLTIPAGSTTATIQVPLFDDTTPENQETFFLDVSEDPSGNNTEGGTVRAIGTINDDDGSVVLSVTDGATNEGDEVNDQSKFARINFTVSLNRPSDQTVSVSVATQGVTATAGSDFQSAVLRTVPNPADPTKTIDVSASTLVFQPGETSKIVFVKIIGDKTDENDETFTLVLSQSVNATIALPTKDNGGQGTINDDDKGPAVTLTEAAGGSGSVREVDSPARFTVKLASAVGRDLIFNYSVIGSGTTQASREDFTVFSGRVTITADNTTASINANVKSDGINEKDETFSVRIDRIENAAGDPVGGDFTLPAPVGGTIQAEGTITVAESSTGSSKPKEGDNVPARYTVTLSARTNRATVVNYVVQNTGTDATSNADFENAPTVGTISRSITIPAGATTGQISIPITDDSDDEKDETFTLRLTDTSGDYALPANGIGGTIVDDDLAFVTNVVNQFTPKTGFPSFGGQQGTTVTLNGNGFKDRPITRVVFGVGSIAPLNATAIDVVSDTQINVVVPFGAYSGPIRVVSAANPAVTTNSFTVQPVTTDITPRRGVERLTEVTITGLHFRNDSNEVTGVRFNGVASTPGNQAGFRVISDTEIRAIVPIGATTGKITLVTGLGQSTILGPPSADTFTVDGVTAGGIKFISASAAPVIESDTGNKNNPIASYTLALDPAIEQGAPGPVTVPPLGAVTVAVTVNSTSNSAGFPVIVVVDPKTNKVVSRGTAATAARVTFPALDRDNPNQALSQRFTVILVDAGDDFEQGAQNITISAQILRSNDPTNYPTSGPKASIPDVVFPRLDLHGLVVNTTTVLRTFEDPTFRLQRNRTFDTQFDLALANLDFPATDGSVIRDNRPKFDVLVAVQTSDVSEGLVSTVVVDEDNDGPGPDIAEGVVAGNGGAGQPIPQETLQVLYSTDRTSPDFFRNQHLIRVTGVDDADQDGDQRYSIIVNDIASADSEYNGLTFNAPVTILNTDNEQTGNSGQKGFIFSPVSGTPAVPRLTVSESGTPGFFTVRLSAQPTADVLLTLASSDTTEGLLVAPNDDTVTQNQIRLRFTPNGPNGVQGNTSRWDVQQTVTVRGQDDLITDGDQDFEILTSSSSADLTYNQIDPPNPIVTTTDDDTTGVSVFPQSLTIEEGATEVFNVRLNARPTANVTIDLVPQDPTIAVIDSGRRLTFTPSNFNVLQAVTVRGVSDGTFVARRITTIVSSNAASSDPAYNNVVVPDIDVTVLNNDTAFDVTPNKGLQTSEDGQTTTFQVRLTIAPTAEVNIDLSSSNAGEVIFSVLGQRTATTRLTFTPDNFSTFQTVTLVGVDDSQRDDNQTFQITGRVVTTDTTYSSQPFPLVTGTNLDNEVTSGNGSATFAANSTFLVSFPYAGSFDGNKGVTDSVSVNNVFSVPLIGRNGQPNFRLFRWKTSDQDNIGNNLVALSSTSRIKRGEGYQLRTLDKTLTINSTLQPIPKRVTSFSINLELNPNFGGAPSSNGFNLIGFPFNPNTFRFVNFTNSRVVFGTNRYETVTEAAAAGVMSNKLFTRNASGEFVEISSSSNQIQAFQGIYVQTFKNNVKLVLRNPQ